MTPVDQLLWAAAELPVLPALFGPGPPRTLLCDDLWLAALADRGWLPPPAAEVTVRALASGMPDGDGRAVVLAATGERNAVAAVQRRRPDRPAWGLCQAILPRLICGCSPWTAPPPAPTPPPRRVAILATPRTGSSVLCDALAAAGLGRPKEHLRDPLVHLLTGASDSGVDGGAVLAEITRLDSRNGVFATKLICHYLFDVVDAGGDGAAMLAAAWLEGARIVHLTRDNLVLQAISSVFALHGGWFHAWTDAEATAAQRSVPAYDFDRLHDRVAWLAGQRDRLAAVAGRFADPLQLVYERDIDGDPAAAVVRVATAAAVPVRPVPDPVPLRRRLRTAVTADFERRFRADFCRRYGAGATPEAVFGAAKAQPATAAAVNAR